MLKSINMSTWGVSFNLSTDSNNQGLSAKSLKHSDMNSWMLLCNGASLSLSFFFFLSFVLFSHVVLHIELQEHTHITGTHSHSGYEPVGGSSTWTDMLQHTFGNKSHAFLLAVILFALLNKTFVWHYNILYKMQDKRTQMRNTAKSKTTHLTRLEPPFDNRSSSVSIRAHRPQR